MIKKSKEWYTLVELIVVLVILSILATLWFSTYTSHLSWARDTQRHSDLSILNNSIKNIFVRGFNPLVIVDTLSINNTGISTETFYTAWKDIVWDSNYKAWSIKFEYLTELNKDILDPKTNDSYIVWVYKNTYELATIMEDTEYAYIIRSNRARTSSWTLSELEWTVDNINNILTLKNIEDSIKFAIWDYISDWWTWTWDIVNIINGKIYVNEASWFTSW